MTGGGGSRFDLLRIGLLVPSTNAVMERDLWRHVPPDVTIVTGRLTYNRRLAPIERLERQLDAVPLALADITSAGVDVVLYGCTSGSFVHGRGWEKDFADGLKSRAACPVVLTARALVDAAQTAGIARALVVTPYQREVNERLVRYLEDAGIETTELVVLEGSPVETIDPKDIHKSVLGVPVDRVDGLIVACTALRAWEALEPLERALRRPVVTSNQAALQAALRFHPEGRDG